MHTPYLDYSFRREDGKDIYTIHQRFARPLKIVMRQNIGQGRYIDTTFSADSVQTIVLPTRQAVEELWWAVKEQESAKGNDFNDIQPDCCEPVDISGLFNANVTDIFQNQYLSPRSPYTTLCLPTQGIGDWCSPKRQVEIDDSGVRSNVHEGTFKAIGIPFQTPQEGKNIVYTSLWDNYPDSVTIPISGQGSRLYLMMAGSTNPMQSHFTNGIIRVTYTDGTQEVLELRNPDNWCPMEQDYEDDGLAFTLPSPRPYRFGLASGKVSRTLFKDLSIDAFTQASDIPENKRPVLYIPGGAGQLLDMPINPGKQLRSLTLTTLANDVVIGLMGVTLQK